MIVVSVLLAPLILHAFPFVELSCLSDRGG